MPWLRSAGPASDTYGHHWPHAGAVVRVDDDQAAVLLGIQDGGLSLAEPPAEDPPAPATPVPGAAPAADAAPVPDPAPPAAEPAPEPPADGKAPTKRPRTRAARS